MVRLHPLACDFSEEVLVIERLFNPDAPVWAFMGRVADAVLLNLLAIVLSLPVITIGASLTALDEAARKALAGTDGEPARVFLRSWWANLLPATALWLVVGGVGAGISALWLVFVDPAFLPLKLLASSLFVLIFPFVWALQSRFENPIGRTLLNAAMIAVARLPFAAAIVATDAALVGLGIAVACFIPAGAVLSPMLGIGLLALVNVPILDRALRPWMQHPDSRGDVPPELD